MSQFFFRTPFGTSGDITAVPNDVQVDGSVSYTQGFGPDYQADNSDIGVRYPERGVINDLFKVVTQALQILQTHGFPDFITSSDNGGSAYLYDKNACTRYSDGIVYYSLVNSNTALPTDATKWTPLFPVSSFKTGMTIIHEDTSLPDATWVWANGQTIGNAASGGTGRANADTVALFTQIWNTFPQTIRPVTTSAGAPSTRGISAAADYAANKRIPLRDMRDVVPAGWGTMGGAADRGLLTAANTLGVDGSILGATGGEQAHTQQTTELAIHSHTDSLSVGSTILSVSQVPQHRHYITAKDSVMVGSPPTQEVDNTQAATYYGANNSREGVAYILTKQTTGGNIDANAGLSSVPIAGGAALGHTHSLAGSIDSTGSSAASNIVQPTTICNFITKL